MSEILKPLRDAAGKTAQDAGSLFENLTSPAFRGIEYGIQGRFLSQTRAHIGAAFEDALSLVFKSPLRFAWAAVKSGSRFSWELLKHTPFIPVVGRWHGERREVQERSRSGRETLGMQARFRRDIVELFRRDVLGK